MNDTIKESRSDLEPFKKEVVDEYTKNENNFNKYPLRHYSQIKTVFNKNEVKIMLDKLKIPINIRTTIFGGYTGQFANCLRDIGMKVIFTDPLDEWVRNAIDFNLESYKYSAEEIPENIIGKTDLFATFECYMPFASLSNYTILRFLTTKYGILFAESKRTREEIKREHDTKLQLKYSFFPFAKIYSIKRSYREKDDLRLYHFISKEENKIEINKDCKIMKLIYDNFSDKATLTKESILEFADKNGIETNELFSSINRIYSLFQLEVGPLLRPYFHDVLDIISKRFFIDKSLTNLFPYSF